VDVYIPRALPKSSHSSSASVQSLFYGTIPDVGCLVKRPCTLPCALPNAESSQVPSELRIDDWAPRAMLYHSRRRLNVRIRICAFVKWLTKMRRPMHEPAGGVVLASRLGTCRTSTCNPSSYTHARSSRWHRLGMPSVIMVVPPQRRSGHVSLLYLEDTRAS
jgi:hypothetical protein